MNVNLQEIVHPKMNILFLALNPPVNSNNNGHYFSNNLSFWNLLNKSGLITQSVKSKITGDEVFRKQGINHNRAIFGITDLVHDLVETKSNLVSVEKVRVKRILNILDNSSTKILCLMHSKVSNAFQDAGFIIRNRQYGQVGKYKSTLIYEVPFHNASIGEKEKYYSMLKEQL